MQHRFQRGARRGSVRDARHHRPHGGGGGVAREPPAAGGVAGARARRELDVRPRRRRDDRVDGGVLSHLRRPPGHAHHGDVVPGLHTPRRSRARASRQPSGDRARRALRRRAQGLPSGRHRPLGPRARRRRARPRGQAHAHDWHRRGRDREPSRGRGPAEQRGRVPAARREAERERSAATHHRPGRPPRRLEHFAAGPSRDVVGRGVRHPRVPAGHGPEPRRGHWHVRAGVPRHHAQTESSPAPPAGLRSTSS